MRVSDNINILSFLCLSTPQDTTLAKTFDKPDNMHTLRLPSSLCYLCMLDFVAFWISLKDNRENREKQRWFIVLIIYQYVEELWICTENSHLS